MLRLEYDSAYEELFGSQADLVRRIMEHAPAERKLEFALITGLPVTFCGELFPREAPVRFASPLLTDEGVEAIAGSSGLPREAVREILENAPYEAAAIALAAAYCLTAESAWEQVNLKTGRRSGPQTGSAVSCGKNAPTNPAAGRRADPQAAYGAGGRKKRFPGNSATNRKKCFPMRRTAG